eukprot:1161432-Pelagomonas_calceolata.AAC.2
MTAFLQPVTFAMPKMTQAVGTVEQAEQPNYLAEGYPSSRGGPDEQDSFACFLPAPPGTN